MLLDNAALRSSEFSRRDVMIPEEKSAGVARALQETLNVTEFEDINRMTKDQFGPGVSHRGKGFSVLAADHDSTPYGSSVA
jgi:hypothetical protein